MHSGGAYGGHYYAYIKANDGKWYHFNDSFVNPIEEAEIEKAFGGSSGSNGNAYMLLYRKYNTV